MSYLLIFIYFTLNVLRKLHSDRIKFNTIVKVTTKISDIFFILTAKLLIVDVEC